MTDYAYKLVSLKLGGTTDWEALKRARDKGWEPVPLGEEPVPTINPLDMTPEQLTNLTLCRMTLDKHTAMVEDLARLNAALAANTTHEIIALYKVRGSWPPAGYLLHRDIVGEDAEGNPIWVDVFATEDMLAGAKLAYAWLSERGLL